jgi:hypothetical protein
MEAVDSLLRGLPTRVPRRTLALLASAALGLSACSGVRDPDASRAARGTAEAALDLYEAGEFILAAERFSRASMQAAYAREGTLERNSVTGECLSWLHARRLQELAECTRRLEALQRRARRPDPGVNTLVGLGAVAGHRPLPPLRIPTSVRPMVKAAAREEQR